MAKTNEPILLNQTGLELVDLIQQENSLLTLLAEEKREAVYNNISQIASIVRQGYGEQTFPIGDQIIVPWKDMDDGNHNTDDTAYPIVWDILHHGMVELESGETVPGMFIGWHLCSPYGVQFSNYQAFYNAKTEALPAGTYNVTYNSVTYQFTLTQDVPKGGRISGFEGGFAENKAIKSWARPTDASPIETVTATIGSEGMSLGTVGSTRLSAEGLNCQQRINYGSNRWKTSAIRQYLNKSGNNWFVSQEDFDIRPDQHTKKAFMSGFNADFLNAIRPVKVTTALNTVEGYANTSEDTYDTFFLASLEQIYCTPQLRSVEGPYWEYWKRRLGLTEPAGYHPKVYDGYKIPAVNNSSPQYVRLRSAHRGHAYYAWHVYSSGYVNDRHAFHARRFSPVCVIC